MITKIKCDTHEEWVAQRNKAIGGSDAGAILGFSLYKSPYALWAEKTGAIIPEDISDKEAVRLGNDLEQYVADRFCEATGKKVQRVNYTLVNDAYPFAHANIDRKVVGEDAGLECKTTSSWEILQQCREGDYPSSWYAQIVHYMMVTGYKKWYLAVLVFGHGFFWFEIERKDSEISALISAEREFWDLVVKNTPPALDGSEATQDALRTIFKTDNGSAIDLMAVGPSIEIYNSIGKQIAELEKLRDEHQAAIMQYMGEAAKGSYGNVTISWKAQERKTFDRKAYEKAFGQIPDTFMKVSSVRPFKVTIKK